MRKIIAVVLTLALCGCAETATQPQKVWYKDGATQDESRRDQMSCRQYGMQSAQAHGLAGNMFVEWWILDETKKCLTDLGYR